MKYTVTIQQPVQEERRRGLEGQLTERFGLSAEQAGRLSSRRTGRLMKPTSRARAELLLDVFQLAGAAVALEEVHEETRLMSEPFQGVAPSASLPSGRGESRDDAFLAPLLPPPAWPPAPDPFAALNGGVSGGVGGGAVAVAPPVIDGVQMAPAAHDPFAQDASVGNPLTPNPFASVTGSAPSEGWSMGADAPPADVWSDFTGSLSLSDAPSTELSGAGAPNPLTTTMVPVVIPAVSGDAGAGEAGSRAPRRSLTRQLTLNTLAPLALSSAVTLGLLAVALPMVQRQAAQQHAQTLAALVGGDLGGVPAAQVNARLGSVVATPGLGFVRAELPSGQSTLRASDAAVGSRSKELSAWLTTHSGGGLLTLGKTQYIVAQATFRRGAAGQAELAPAGTTGGGQVLRRVVVGVPNTQASAALRTALLLVLVAALLGLFLASLLARRAAAQITEPIERLVKAADAISMGDLSRPVHADQNDEIGDLALALERMRQSLEAAMERLRRRRKS